jgi:hypothetical protein
MFYSILAYIDRRASTARFIKELAMGFEKQGAAIKLPQTSSGAIGTDPATLPSP